MTTVQVNAQIQQGLSILSKDEGMMRQVAQYIQRLVNKMKKNEKSEVVQKHYKHEILCGIIDAKGATDRELINEYLSEKYGV